MIQINYANFFNETPVQFVDRKLLKQINLDIKHSSGIYKISNLITGDCYIGKAKDVFVRIGQHKSLLRSNKHKYKNGELSILQKAWNKYGAESFKFETIERCIINELDEREKYWINYYQCNCSKTRHGYNATDGGEGAFGNTNVKGRIQVNNGEIQKMILPEELDYYISIGFNLGILPSTIEKINRNRQYITGEDHHNYGVQMSDEQKEKISKALKGKYIGENSPNFGKHHTEESKEKLRNMILGKKHSNEAKKKISNNRKKQIVQLTKNYEYIKEFDSGLDAENETGISRSHICQCCKNKRKTAGGFIWRFKDEYLGKL